MNIPNTKDGTSTLSVAEMEEIRKERERELRMEQGLATESDKTRMHIHITIKRKTPPAEDVQDNTDNTKDEVDHTTAAKKRKRIAKECSQKRAEKFGIRTQNDLLRNKGPMNKKRKGRKNRIKFKKGNRSKRK